MKKQIIVLCAIALCGASSAWARTPKFLTPQELTAHLQQPQNIQGQFVQQRHLKSLAKPMKTSGEFALKKHTGLLWHVQKPLNLQLRVRQDGIAQWDAVSRTWRASKQAGQAAQVKLLMSVLGGDIVQLNEQFDYQTFGTTESWELILYPKTLTMKQIFNKIVIKGQQTVQQVTLYEKQGDRTVMAFSQIKLNQALSQNAINAFK